ncbi:uncharacterized protein LOC113351620 [Papaver somniferum]|uniref:uncharacterized protein LOC113351620 n=1 Tax=Papaver somniferum TaxID=3469 RepID=UPI000E703645|nr:uncharacterized protein LOC113351620 [Papaver somniferum]
MWLIWKERCDRVFEHKTINSIALSLEIQRHIDFWSTKIFKVAKKTQKKKNKNPWSAPNLGTPKFNVDATWLSESLPSTYALILRNAAGEGESAGQAAGLDPQEAEAIGIWQTTVWAKDHQIQNFSIEVDCESLFNFINGKTVNISWRAIAYMLEAHRLAKLCNNFLGFFFVPRLGNQLADSIAKSINNRRYFLQEPNTAQLGPLDGMHISYFTATDSQFDS